MTDATKVWMPDTFFRNEKIGRFHNILQSNLYVRVFPNGDVLYSIRVSLTCACSMHLALFPLDKQTCNLDVASCEYDFFLKGLGWGNVSKPTGKVEALEQGGWETKS